MQQAWMQLAVLAITLAISTVTGYICGAILKSLPIAEPMNDDFYEDAGWWNVPDDDEEAPEMADNIERQHDLVLRDALKKVGDAIGRDLITGTKLASLPPTHHALGHTHRQAGTMPKQRARYSANYRFLEGSEHGMDHLFFPDASNPNATRQQQMQGVAPSPYPAVSMSPVNVGGPVMFQQGYRPSSFAGNF
jgi:hypothetical protein